MTPFGAGAPQSPAGQVLLPRAGSVALAVAVVSHLVAAAVLVGSWSRYHWPWAAVVLLAMSAAVPLATAVAGARARSRGDALPVRVRVGAPVGVVVVSAGLLADLPPQAWSSWSAWNWATGAKTLLVLALQLRPLWSAALAVGFGALAVGAVLAGGGDAWDAEAAAVVASVPPLVLGHYLRLYRDALHRRAADVDRRVRAAVPDLVGEPAPRPGDDRRLADLRDRIEPLLREVAQGAPLPLDAGRSADARRTARHLRDALAAQRRSLWLPPEAGGAPVHVVATDGVTRDTGDAERGWLAALVELLGAHPGWDQVRVVLDRRLDGSVMAVVTAEGAPARGAAGDPRLQSLCATRSARCDADGGLLVVEAELMTKIGA